MICVPNEIDIEVLYSRISKGDLNLQPSFQRGEVWSSQKQKRLIDSVLRDWKIPPIHVILTKNYKEEVLDGQQRLVAIRDFIENKIKIDGNILPENDEIKSLNGLYFTDLDEELQRKFKMYALTKITLKEYKPEEPAELFFRLNQPATLTSAEQRNAYISESRNQIKRLVEQFEGNGAKTEVIGFSNSRLAYDEVISKFCYTLEINTLRKKITSSDMSIKYRSEEPFNRSVERIAEDVIRIFTTSISNYAEKKETKLELNKATLYSWLIFTYRNINEISSQDLAKTVFDFEVLRQYVKGKQPKNLNESYIIEKVNAFKDYYDFIDSMMLLFNQRASMGSTDALSIIYRDIILAIFKEINTNSISSLVTSVAENYSLNQNFNLCLEKIYNEYNWGKVLR
jgi:hypothetical protein